MSDSTRFVREAHAIVHDLFEPRPIRYWADLLGTTAVAYAGLAVYLATTSSAVRAAAMLVSALAMYRGVVFIHEIAHRPAGSFTAFTVVWNALCGIPFWAPSFLYGDHRGHHARPTYGTPADAEYLRLAAHPRVRMVVFLSLALIYPVLGFLRFLLLTPLALIARSFDRVIWTRASSLYNMNETYVRPYDAQARSVARWVQELAACAWAWFALGLVVTGRVPWTVVAKVYAVFAVWTAVNQMRTLAAHRYANHADTPISHLDQVRDTNTFSHGWLPCLWAPLGMRYHALHHMLPMLPYHAMGAAHRRLMERLPSPSLYRATVRQSLVHCIASMWREQSGRDGTRVAPTRGGPSRPPSID